MSELLDRALKDLAAHPDSTAQEIADRLGADPRLVFRELDTAAYEGRCQRWRDGNPRSAWRWEIPEGAEPGG